MSNIDINSGLSSMLFIISAIKSINVSKSIYWILSNHILILSSFLYYSDIARRQLYLALDYSAIILLSLSYINNFYTTIIGLGLGLYEYSLFNNVESTKNVFAIIAVLFALYRNYNLYFYKLIFIIFLCASIYFYRYYLYKYNIQKYTSTRIYLTLILHIISVIILCMLSETI